MSVPYLIHGSDELTFYVNGTPHMVHSSHPNWAKIRDGLNLDSVTPQELVELAKPITAIKNGFIEAESSVDPEVQNYLAEGKLTVTLNGVYYDGEELNTTLTERLLDVLAAGFDVVPWIKFMANLYRNPSVYAREELFDFLERSDMPITSDGCFLAYKKVRDDYRDVYSGTFDNTPGNTVELKDRTAVDPNRHNVCSRGLHFCSKNYLSNFGGTRIVIVKINPADVVSIPTDYGFSKGRTWKYVVVGEVDPEEAADYEWNAVEDWGNEPEADEVSEVQPVGTLSDDDDDDDDFDYWDDEMVTGDDDDGDDGDLTDEAYRNVLTTLSITVLRRMASNGGKGLKNAYKGGYTKNDLIEYLVRNKESE